MNKKMATGGSSNKGSTNKGHDTMPQTACQHHLDSRMIWAGAYVLNYRRHYEDNTGFKALQGFQLG